MVQMGKLRPKEAQVGGRPHPSLRTLLSQWHINHEKMTEAPKAPSLFKSTNHINSDAGEKPVKRGALPSPDTSQFSGTDHTIHWQLRWALPSGSLSIPSPPRHPHQHQPRLSHAHLFLEAHPLSPRSPVSCPSTKGQTQRTSRILLENVGRGGFTHLVDEECVCEGRGRGRELHLRHSGARGSQEQGLRGRRQRSRLSSRAVCRARAESCLISHPRRVRYHSP